MTVYPCKASDETELMTILGPGGAIFIVGPVHEEGQGVILGPKQLRTLAQECLTWAEVLEKA